MAGRAGARFAKSKGALPHSFRRSLAAFRTSAQRARRRSNSSTRSRSSSDKESMGRSVRDLMRSRVEATRMNCAVSPSGSSGSFSTYARYASVTSESDTSDMESLRSSMRLRSASSGPLYISVAMLNRSLMFLARFDLNVQFVELFWSQRLGSFHDSSLTTACHRESLHLAQMRFAGEIHYQTFNTESDTPVWGRAVSESSEHMPDASLGILLAVPHHIVDSFEYLGLMRADATTPGLIPVAYQVVLGRQYFADVFFFEQLLHMLGDGHGEGVVSKGPAAFGSFLEKWKSMNPRVRKYPTLLVFRRTEVKFVRTEFQNGLRIGEAREWFFFYRVAHVLNDRRYHYFHLAHHIFLLDERHLNVYLCMFETPVGAQVFVTNSPRYLKIPFESSHHEELFVVLG